MLLLFLIVVRIANYHKARAVSVSAAYISEGDHSIQNPGPQVGHEAQRHTSASRIANDANECRLLPEDQYLRTSSEDVGTCAHTFFAVTPLL